MGTSLGGGIGNVVSFKADGDLSAKQFYGVGLQATANTVGTTGLTGTTRIMGVLVNKPKAAGQPADVQIDGIAKVITNGPVAVGAPMICGTGGKWAAIVAADAAGSYISAIALEAATASIASGGGDIISAKLVNIIGTTS